MRLISFFSLVLNSWTFDEFSLLLGVNGSNSDGLFLLFVEVNKGFVSLLFDEYLSSLFDEQVSLSE